MYFVAFSSVSENNLCAEWDVIKLLIKSTNLVTGVLPKKIKKNAVLYTFTLYRSLMLVKQDI